MQRNLSQRELLSLFSLFFSSLFSLFFSSFFLFLPLSPSISPSTSNTEYTHNYCNNRLYTGLKELATVSSLSLSLALSLSLFLSQPAAAERHALTHITCPTLPAPPKPCSTLPLPLNPVLPSHCHCRRSSHPLPAKHPHMQHQLSPARGHLPQRPQRRWSDMLS